MKKFISVFASAVIGGLIMTVYVITPYLLKTGSHWLDFLEILVVAFVMAVTMMITLGVLIFAFKGAVLPQQPQRKQAPAMSQQPGCEICTKHIAVIFNRDHDKMLCADCMMKYNPKDSYCSVPEGIVQRLTKRRDTSHVQNT